MQLANRQSSELLNLKKPKTALKLLHRTESLIKKLDDEALKNSLKSLTYNSMACIYKETKQLQNALDCLEKAISLGIKSGEKGNLGVSYLNASAILNLIGNHAQSKGYAENAVKCVSDEIEELRNIGTDPKKIQEKEALLGFAFLNSGIQDEHLGSLRSAITNYNNAKELTDNNPETSEDIKVKITNCIQNALRNYNSNRGPYHKNTKSYSGSIIHGEQLRRSRPNSAKNEEDKLKVLTTKKTLNYPFRSLVTSIYGKLDTSRDRPDSAKTDIKDLKIKHQSDQKMSRHRKNPTAAFTPLEIDRYSKAFTIFGNPLDSATNKGMGITSPSFFPKGSFQHGERIRSSMPNTTTSKHNRFASMKGLEPAHEKDQVLYEADKYLNNLYDKVMQTPKLRKDFSTEHLSRTKKDFLRKNSYSKMQISEPESDSGDELKDLQKMGALNWSEEDSETDEGEGNYSKSHRRGLQIGVIRIYSDEESNEDIVNQSERSGKIDINKSRWNDIMQQIHSDQMAPDLNEPSEAESHRNLSTSKSKGLFAPDLRDDDRFDREEPYKTDRSAAKAWAEETGGKAEEDISQKEGEAKKTFREKSIHKEENNEEEEEKPKKKKDKDKKKDKKKDKNDESESKPDKKKQKDKEDSDKKSEKSSKKNEESVNESKNSIAPSIKKLMSKKKDKSKSEINESINSKTSKKNKDDSKKETSNIKQEKDIADQYLTETPQKEAKPVLHRPIKKQSSKILIKATEAPKMVTGKITGAIENKPAEVAVENANSETVQNMPKAEISNQANREIQEKPHPEIQEQAKAEIKEVQKVETQEKPKDENKHTEDFSEKKEIAKTAISPEKQVTEISTPNQNIESGTKPSKIEKQDESPRKPESVIDENNLERPEVVSDVPQANFQVINPLKTEEKPAENAKEQIVDLQENQAEIIENKNAEAILVDNGECEVEVVKAQSHEENKFNKVWTFAEIKKKEAAATKINAHAKGHLQRKNYKLMKNKLVEKKQFITRTYYFNEGEKSIVNILLMNGNELNVILTDLNSRKILKTCKETLDKEYSNAGLIKHCWVMLMRSQEKGTLEDYVKLLMINLQNANKEYVKNIDFVKSDIDLEKQQEDNFLVDNGPMHAIGMGGENSELDNSLLNQLTNRSKKDQGALIVDEPAKNIAITEQDENKETEPALHEDKANKENVEDKRDEKLRNLIRDMIATEDKKEENLPEIKQEDPNPEVKNIIEVPEIKAEEQKPEVKNIIEVPEIKQEKPKPEIKNESKPEIKNESIPEIKSEQKYEPIVEKIPEKLTEKSLEKITEKSMEKSSDKPLEKSSEKPREKTPEKAPEKAPEKTPSQSPSSEKEADILKKLASPKNIQKPGRTKLPPIPENEFAKKQQEAAKAELQKQLAEEKKEDENEVKEHRQDVQREQFIHKMSTQLIVDTEKGHKKKPAMIQAAQKIQRWYRRILAWDKVIVKVKGNYKHIFRRTIKLRLVDDSKKYSTEKAYNEVRIRMQVLAMEGNEKSLVISAMDKRTKKRYKPAFTLDPCIPREHFKNLISNVFFIVL